MPFFKDLKTKTIVYRKFEINSEVIDGLIEPVNENETFYLLMHIPNNKWSYDVKIEKEGNINDIYLDFLNVKDTKKDKKIFYDIILKKDFNDYLNENNYTELKLTNNIIQNIKQVNIPQKENKIEVKTNIRGISLVRDNEPLVYKFKSPGER